MDKNKGNEIVFGKSHYSSFRAKLSLLKYILFVFRNRPRSAEKSTDILAISNYEGNPAAPNRMTTAYVKAPGFNTVEWLYSPVLLNFPKIRNTFSFDYFLYKALIWNRLLRFFKKSEVSYAIDSVIGIVRENFGDILGDGIIEELRLELIRTDEICVLYSKLLRKSLKDLHPRLVICSEGNNGDWRHHILFRECRSLKIPTVEVQHGTFNEGMRYGEKIAGSPELKNVKSDYLFTFGKYHRTQTNLPSECIPVGHYPLEMELDAIAGKREALNSDKLKILFICEGLPPSSKNNAFINTTVKALEGFRQPFELIVRLHHSESENEKYNGFFRFQGTRYSHFDTENIYLLLATADIVILHASTVAFESVYFGKEPLVFEDDLTSTYVPENIGYRFKDSEDLIRLLDSIPKDEAMMDSNKISEYWVQGRVLDNFKKFWTDVLEKNHTSFDEKRED